MLPKVLAIRPNVRVEVAAWRGTEGDARAPAPLPVSIRTSRHVHIGVPARPPPIGSDARKAPAARPAERRRAIAPIIDSPPNISAHVPGSGTGAVRRSTDTLSRPM